jgi:hypothetical protein
VKNGEISEGGRSELLTFGLAGIKAVTSTNIYFGDSICMYVL